MREKINDLYSNDATFAYKTLLELETISTYSNELYNYFDIFLSMLKSDKTFIKIRGFRLICSLSKWDTDNKIDENIDSILETLDDEIGIAIRQCLSKLNLILLYKPYLDVIKIKLEHIDLLKYKESMRPLIEKDINNILNNL